LKELSASAASTSQHPGQRSSCGSSERWQDEAT